MTTKDKVLAAIAGQKLKQESSNRWRCHSPLRAGSDAHSFVITINDDGEHGGYIDHVSGETGSLYELAAALNIETPKPAQAENTKREYRDLAEYAAVHGVTEDVFLKAGWANSEKFGRKCLSYPTANGNRYRFIDGGKPTYINDDGYKACWYGLHKAAQRALESNMPIILCNGEASTVVAQHYGLPACAVTTGEKRLPDNLLAELNTAWSGEIIIAMDCDDTGRRVAKEINAQLPKSKIANMQLTEHGDLADFCKLYGSRAYDELKTRILPVFSGLEADTDKTQTSVLPTKTDVPILTSVYSDDIARQAMHNIGIDVAPKGKPVIVPFKSLHQFGGFARFLVPGKVTLFAAPSGNGKTVYLETWVDAWLRGGEFVQWYGTEFEPSEYHNRRVQRYSTITTDMLRLHEIWKWEHYAGIQENQREGVRLTPAQDREYLAACSAIARWQGRCEYFPPAKTIGATLDHMGNQLEVSRRANQPVSVIVIDYLQLLNVAEKTNPSNIYEQAAGEIKYFAQTNHVHIIVGSQVTKEATGKVKRNQGFDVSQMNWIREDKANFVLGLQTIYEPSGEYDENQDEIFVPTNRAKLHVLKNSEGQKGFARITSHFPKLVWIDKDWRSEVVSMNAAGD